MNQSTRPIHISSILKVIDSEYPDSMGVPLKAYISNLEARQQEIPPMNDLTLVTNLNQSPFWSHKRSVGRQQHRQAHALRKLNQ